MAAREVAATLAKGTSNHLHVLSVYDYPALNVGYLPTEIASRQQDALLQRTAPLMVQKMDAYIAPLRAEGVALTPHLRTGNPREVLVQVATAIKAALWILGSHRKRGLLDIALGGTAQPVSKSAPCLVVLVSPQRAGSGGKQSGEDTR